MAPEVVKNPLKDHPDDFKNETRYHYNVVVDSWAIGCLAYELLAGFPPFTAQTQQQVTHNINNMQVQYSKKMSEDAVDFIKGALERIPHERATTTELIKHPWVQQHMVSVCAARALTGNTSCAQDARRRCHQPHCSTLCFRRHSLHAEARLSAQPHTATASRWRHQDDYGLCLRHQSGQTARRPAGSRPWPASTGSDGTILSSMCPPRCLTSLAALLPRGHSCQALRQCHQRLAHA